MLPVHPDAHKTILDGYAARLANAPEDVPALTGASFARWWFFDYANSIHLLNRLLERTEFNGSSVAEMIEAATPIPEAAASNVA